MMSESLEKLEQLTHELSDVPTSYDSPSVHLLRELVKDYLPKTNSRLIAMEIGDPLEEWGIFKTDEIAVSVVKGKAGALCMEHIHQHSVEYYIIASGKVAALQRKKLYGIDKIFTRKAKSGEIICIPKGVPHRCRIDKDAMFIVITIPADPDMPESPLYKGI